MLVAVAVAVAVGSRVATDPQAVQLARPGSAAMCPALHGVQLELLEAAAWVPRGHCMHGSMPVDALNEPGPHVRHSRLEKTNPCPGLHPEKRKQSLRAVEPSTLK